MDKAFRNVARAATLLALAVVVIGAWVRLTDAGLGCPDWPGCYGRLLVSAGSAADPAAAELTAIRPLDTGKAWREMIHRYLASALGLLCLALAVIALRNRASPEQPLRAPLALVVLVGFQGLLGMWTVTLLLKPLVVVAHLLGGLATLALLFWLARARAAPLRVGRRVRGARVAGSADCARGVDERELRGARLSGFPHVPNAVVARDRRFRRGIRSLARDRYRL
jgi:cytochrome c oxidase assembly protein subunit 15